MAVLGRSIFGGFVLFWGGVLFAGLIVAGEVWSWKARLWPFSGIPRRVPNCPALEVKQTCSGHAVIVTV
jgi:hypothetical protein